MDYTARIHQEATGRIARWGLSDYLLVEVYLAPREERVAAPLHTLHRDPDGPGSFFVFERVDPESPRFRHVFMFRGYCDEDERHLHVVYGSYWRDLRI